MVCPLYALPHVYCGNSNLVVVTEQGPSKKKDHDVADDSCIVLATRFLSLTCSETAHTVNSNGFSHSALKTFELIRVDKLCIMSISRTNRNNRRSIYLCNWLGKWVDKVNGTGGAACERGGIARPGGAIPGARVGGGTIPGAEVGEETVARACKGNARPGSVIPERSTVRGGRVRSGKGIGFRALPRSLSSSVRVIVNSTALTLDNADTPCCEPAVLGRGHAF